MSNQGQKMVRHSVCVQTAICARTCTRAFRNSDLVRLIFSAYTREQGVLNEND